LAMRPWHALLSDRLSLQFTLESSCRIDTVSQKGCDNLFQVPQEPNFENPVL